MDAVAQTSRKTLIQILLIIAGLVLYFTAYSGWIILKEGVYRCKSVKIYAEAYKVSQEILKERAADYGLKPSDYKLAEYEYENREKWRFLYETPKYGYEPIVVYPNCDVESI